MHYDIAIIGYGPVGAVTANLFGQKGFNTIVIEPKKEIWDIHPMEGINFLNNKGKSIVNINLKLDEPINGYDESVFFNQPIFEKFLRSEAIKHNNIDIKLGENAKENWKLVFTSNIKYTYEESSNWFNKDIPHDALLNMYQKYQKEDVLTSLLVIMMVE